ncbi:probable arabinose 5-phosphate isomerase [Tanacetum coccineum]
MGSLSHFQPNPSPEKETQFIDPNKLKTLFNSQQKYLNTFFDKLDHTQTLLFAQTLLNTTGTIFITGIGKSGFVSKNISQTLVSLGIKSQFLSPVDALHGDIGILRDNDVLVMFSKSGNTEELVRLVPCVKAKGVFLISVTSVLGNVLNGLCDMNVHLPLERELCPFDLAPVTSTAIQMVFGCTVAIAIMDARCLTKEGYAANHPAGRIGKSLIFKVKDVMRKQEELPVCREGDLIMDQLVELTSKGCGCLLVIDDDYHLLGTFTDGDLRRTLKASKEGIFKLTVGEMCNRKPRTITADRMAVEAMKKMEAPPSPVQFLPVINEHNIVIDMSWGWRKILQLRDLVRPFFWMQIRNGLKASLWHDMWTYQCPLSCYISPRDITRERHSLQAYVAESDSKNGLGIGPNVWANQRLPNLGLIATPIFDISRHDSMRWCDLNGNLSDFSVKCAWEVLRPRGQQVIWYHITWFSHCIPRHAFYLWIVKGYRDVVESLWLRNRSFKKVAVSSALARNFQIQEHLESSKSALVMEDAFEL